MGLRDWLGLVRVGNCLVISIAPLTGYLVGKGSSLSAALPLSLSAALVAAWGNIVNDYFDAEADAVTKPWRPIPSGKVAPEKAAAVAFAAAALGVALGFTCSLLCGLTAAAAAVLLYLYSWRLKKSGLAGNILVAALSALSILYGAAASPAPWRALLPAAYAFTIMLGREILKGVEDLAGDAKRGVRTLAATGGPEFAVKISAAVLLAVVAASPLPLLAGYGLAYLVFAVAGVDVPVLAAILYVKKKPEARAWRATRLLKISLLSGLLAFLAGELA